MESLSIEKLVACPICKIELIDNTKENHLACKKCGNLYSVDNNIIYFSPDDHNQLLPNDQNGNNKKTM